MPPCPLLNLTLLPVKLLGMLPPGLQSLQQQKLLPLAAFCSLLERSVAIEMDEAKALNPDDLLMSGESTCCVRYAISNPDVPIRSFVL